jgi:hypothetical protein
VNATHLKLADALPDIYFRCETYGCDLPRRDCVSRQNASGESRSATRTRKGIKYSVRKWLPPRLYFCGSGRCEQGKGIAASLPPQEAIKIRRSGR